MLLRGGKNNLSHIYVKLSTLFCHEQPRVCATAAAAGHAPAQIKTFKVHSAAHRRHRSGHVILASSSSPRRRTGPAVLPSKCQPTAATVIREHKHKSGPGARMHDALQKVRPVGFKDIWG